MNIFVFLTIISVLFIYFGLVYYLNNKEKKAKISFKESLDLVGIPVITLLNEGTKYHFVLDSGADSCFIDSNLLPKDYVSPASTYAVGFSGEASSVGFAKLVLTYKDEKFDIIFKTSDLSSTFKAIKEQTGVQLAGILGSDFLSKNKYVLDYAEMIACHK